jgi:hypothetical protein
MQHANLAEDSGAPDRAASLTGMLGGFDSPNDPAVLTLTDRSVAPEYRENQPDIEDGDPGHENVPTYQSERQRSHTK